MEEARLDVAALYAALDAERVVRDLSWRELARAAGVSPSTLTRMTQKRRPDVDSFAALVAWLGMPADRFIKKPNQPTSADPLAEISVLLRAKAELDEASAKHLETVIRSTYTYLMEQRGAKASPSTRLDELVPQGKSSSRARVPR